MKGLQIGRDFALPFEAVTQTFAILAKRGVGKTYTAARMVEQMLRARLQVCVVDPVGVWWGLRSSSDGQSAGLPIGVLGGDHADLPLSEDMGEAVANLLVDQRVSLVLDFAHFRKAAQTRFMTAFAEALYHRNRNPLHLVLDEADAFAPQRPMKGQERMLGAVEDIVRRGRARGLGVTMITQRPAVLNKDVLTQVEVLVALRTIAPQDRDAVDAWIKVHGTPEQRAELMASLPSLPIGTAWFWSPGWLDVFQQVKVERRETFDSSATPKVGERLALPDVVADVDLEVLREALGASLEKAESQDVGKLQRRIADLQKQLREKPKIETERVEVPVIRDEQLAELKALAGEMIGQAERLLAFGQEIMSLIARVQPPAKPPGMQPVQTRLSVSQQVAKATMPTYEPATDKDEPQESGELKAGETEILKTVARRHPTQLTMSEIATLSGRSIKSSSFQGAISLLKRLGYISGTKSGLNMTEAGLNYLGDDIPNQPQTTKELLEMWRRALQPSAARILNVLVDAYPVALSQFDISQLSGYSITSSAFQGNLSLLKRNGLLEKVDAGYIASHALFIDEKVAV